MRWYSRMGMRPNSLGSRLRDAESRATIARAAAISLEGASGASFGRASVRLHPVANSAIGSTAANHRYDEEYECMGSVEALGALVIERTSVFRLPTGLETCDRRRWYY